MTLLATRMHMQADPDDPRHGTVNGYGNLECRCDRCRKAWAANVRDMRSRRITGAIPEHVHGTDNGYANYRCRCAVCVAQHRIRQRDKYRRLYSAEARGVTPRGTVCNDGHSLLPGSPHVYWRKDGRKMCATCNARRNKARYKSAAERRVS